MLETFKQAKGRVTLTFLFLLLLILTRYLNSDYIFLKTLFATAIMLLVISYDITCQWHKNLWEQMKIFPPEEALSNNVKSVLFLVPKFHLPAHVTCNIHSTSRKALGGPTARCLNGDGPISTLLRRVQKKWAWVPGMIHWTITLVIGIGKK